MYGGEYGALDCASAADTVAKDALAASVSVPINNVQAEQQVEEGKEGEGKGEEETQQPKGVSEDHSDHSSEGDDDNEDDFEEWEHYKSGPFGGSAGKVGHKRDEDFLKLEAAFTSLGLDSKVTIPQLDTVTAPSPSRFFHRALK